MALATVSSLFSVKTLSWLGITLPMMAAPAATTNLTGKITAVSTEGNRIQFSIKITNTGTGRVSGNLRVKPYLVAKNDAQAAAVLPNLESEISLAADGSTTLEYDERLPRLPNKDWYLGAIVNPNWAIDETSRRGRYDNTTDIVSAGQFEVATAGRRRAGQYDLYPRVVDYNEVNYGALNHSLRAIARAPESELGFANELLRALFGVISFETKKVTLLDYNLNDDPENPEKDWYAISWNAEKEANGDDISVDYYSNNILFSHVKPGAYRFFTLLNSQDLLDEGNIDDNMETMDLDLSLTRVPNADVIYIATTGRRQATRTINLKGTYASSVEVEVEIVSSEERLNQTLPTATYTDEQALAITLPSPGAGAYEATLKLKSKTIPEGNAPLRYTQDKSIPVKYWVFPNGEAPVLEKSLDAVELSAHQGRDSGAKRVTFTNTGGAPLEFALKATKPWIKVTPSRGTIQPGARANISIVGTAQANLGGGSFQGNVEGSIIIQANTVEDASASPIQVSLQTDNSSQ